ncbi:hypothetical protein MMC10_008640 [Thelotrema lepadinum]|nr:hypothetical protein [Thelotrema lepadinum]
MQFKTLAGLSLLSLATAQSSDFAGYASEANAYFSSLLGDSSFIGQIEGLATIDPGLINSLQALATPQTNIAALTAPPAVITQLPSPYNSLLLSVFSHDVSIASAHGLLGGTATGGAASTASAGLASASSAVGSIITSAASAASASASASASANAISTAGAPQVTGSPAVLAMGAVAGVIGGLAAFL